MAQAYFKIELNNGTELTTLTHNPAGMKDFSITYKRHAVYGTVIRSIGETMRFVKEGRSFVKSVFDSKGIDGECSIKIKTINLSNKTYTTLYDGELDFSTYKEDSVYVEIGLIDNSNTALLQSRDGIDINLLSTTDLDGNTLTGLPAMQTIELSPIDLVYWADVFDAECSGSQTGITAPPANDSDTLTLTGTVNTNFLGGSFDETNLFYYNSSGSTKRILFKYQLTDIDFSGTINVSSISPESEVRITLNIIRLGDSSILKTYTKTKTDTGIETFSYTASVAETLNYDNIADGDYQGFVVVINWNITSIATFDYDFSMNVPIYELTLLDESTESTTDAFAFRPIDALTRALKIIGITTAPSSTVFGTGGDYELCYLTTGKHIRKFPSDTPFNISFRDLFTALSNIFGVWMSSSFAIDSHSIFLSSTNGLTITEMSNIELSPASDLYFSAINVGYENQSYDESNGLIEYNTEFHFATVNKSDKKKDLVSKVRADSLGIEYTRRKQYGDTGTEDTDGDNDAFIISCVDDTGTKRAEIGSDFTTVKGLKNGDQYYNFLLTPKRNLIRNGLYLNTSLYHQTKEVQYVKSKNNVDLEVDSVSELDGDYSTASTNKLNPLMLSFDTPLTDSLLYYLQNLIYQKMTAGDYEGYLYETKINLYAKKANIKLWLL